MKSSLRIGSYAMFETQYCIPVEIPERTGIVAYRLALPPIVKVHDVFQVSFLKIYVKGFHHLIDWSILQVEPEGEF